MNDDDESSVEERDANAKRSSNNKAGAEEMPSPEPKTAPETPTSNHSPHSNGFHGMMNEDETSASPSAMETTRRLQHQSSQTTSEDDSDSSSSSSDEDDAEERIKRINKENEKRRQERRRRNQDRLFSLGLISAPPKSPTSPMSTHSSPGKIHDNYIDDLPNGMLFMPEPCQGSNSSTDANAPVDDIDDLYKRFPHREGPIKTLLSLIGTTMGQTEYQGNDPFVPPPILVSGPNGSGKTSIVRDVVETLQRHYSARLNPKERRVIGTAYVDCAAIEPSSVEAVLESAYSQLVPAELSHTTKRGKKKKKRKKDSTNEEEPTAKRE